MFLTTYFLEVSAVLWSRATIKLQADLHFVFSSSNTIQLVFHDNVTVLLRRYDSDSPFCL